MIKDPYFKSETIDSVSETLLAEVMPLRNKQKWMLDSSATLLLVLDLQRFFLDPSSHAFVPSGDAILPRINHTVKAARASGVKVLFTRHLNSDADAQKMGTWWRDILSDSSPLSLIDERVDTGSDPVLIKSQYDAFYNTRLKRHLDEHRIRQIVITGVMTHLCCETTARVAYVNGYDVFFGIDMTATYNLDFHRASLLNLAHGFAVPLLSKEITTQWHEADQNGSPG